jgi:hypothetical protein
MIGARQGTLGMMKGYRRMERTMKNNKTNCNVIFLTMLKHISATLPSNQCLHVVPKLACVSYVASQT